MGRLVIGGTLLFVFGLLFVIRGLAAGDSGEIAVGVPGLVIGLGALAFYMLERNEQTPK